MCGIVGILGKAPVAPLLLDALKRLEYRGYDSAGIAVLEEGRLVRLRAEGKLVHLEEKLKTRSFSATIGIGHTRWATHGPAVERNAHPHMTNRVAVVHNGIIENFVSLREELKKDTYVFQTDTDTEAVAFLVDRELSLGKAPLQAVKSALARLKGAFALAFIFVDQEDLMIATRRGAPLALGRGNGEMFLGSDAFALAPFSSQVTYLEDGDLAMVTHTSFTIFDEKGEKVIREEKLSAHSSLLVSKENYRHFMQKEIFEQPEALSHALGQYLDFSQGKVVLKDQKIDWHRFNRISFISCGTSYYASLIGKYWFERFAGLAIEHDVASEFRYREPPILEDSLAVLISQSGETADTLACLRYCKQHSASTAAIVNVVESSIAREAGTVFPIFAGPEIGVASTKAFTAQLLVLACLAVSAGKARGKLDEAQEDQFVQALIELPRMVGQALQAESAIKLLCRELVSHKHMLYLGRGTSYPIALEGALKLKELSYIHAEAYAAGELKHGPIALIDESMPVVIVAPYDRWFEKTLSNMQEVVARGGKVILITDEKGMAANPLTVYATIVMPIVSELIMPMIYAIPVQLLAYHMAVALGTDVDQPRNLAKSVTVE